MAKYSSSSEYKQGLYLDILPQENMRYTLEAQESTLDLYYTFVEGKLERIHVLEVQGDLQMQKSISASSLDNAKDFLKSYQNYSKNAFYGNLESMLTNVDANKNATAISRNIKLAVTAQDDSTTFRWTYTFNGIEAPDKCVALHYENGFLSYFIDKWDLYKIGTTSVNISEQKAIDIAMAHAKAYTWATVIDNKTVEDLKYNVTNAMVWTTVFANSLFMDNPRGQDPLMLYPMRHIWVSFDKFYPGNVYGMNVYVWADTGEIGHVQERFSTVDSQADLVATADDIVARGDDQSTSVRNTQSHSLLAMIMLSAFAVLLIGTVVVCLCQKKSLPKSFGLPKPCPLKIGGVLMCILIASIMLFAVLTPTVAALPLYGRATIWGSESRDAWNSTLNLSWRKHPNEVTRQVATSAFIRSEFNQNGYYASDYQGSKGSNKDSILAQIGSNQLNYPRVAVVDFDHGNGNTGVIPEAPNEFHYMFEDQRGTFSGSVCHPPPADHPEYGVYDYEIYPNTNLGKYFFVLINACNSAHVNTTFFGYYPSTQGIIPGTNRARGMPYAWTHRLVQNRDTYPGFNTSDHMSDDGYARPDNGDFVYLGFYLGSAALTQDVDGFNGPRPYWLWLEHFISYAVRNNWSVKQALNQASLDFYGANFGQIPLHTSYTAIWPMFYSDWPGGQPYWHNGSGQQGPGSRMMVYGNSNIKLYQPLLTLSASGGLSPTFTIDGQPYGTGSHRLISDTYTVNVNDISGYQFNYFIYNGGYYSRPASLQIAQDRTITAHYTLLPYINILPDTGGYTIPPAGYYPGSGSMQIQAIASAGYYFVEWRLNGEYLSSNPTVYVDYGANTVEPVFAMDDPEYADLTITAWECMYYTEVEVQIDCDGEYFCTTPIYNDDSLYTGWYTFSNSQYECLYISVTAGGGQYYEYGNSVYLYLDTSPVIIDFYFY